MAIDYDQIKTDLAQAIADAIAAASAEGFATLPLLGLGIGATWNGTNTVTVPVTGSLSLGNFIKSNTDGNWYKILAITPDTSIVVEDTYGIGSFPTGGSPTNLAATLVWDGTNVVTTTDTSELSVGDSIRLNADGNWFIVGSITVDTSVFLSNPGSFTIPTGSTTSSKAGTSFTTTVLPSPPTGNSLVPKIGEPIAIPVVDEGFITLDAQPKALWNRTVAELASIPTPLPGYLVYVTNESGGAVPAFFDGTNWRRVTDRAIVT